MRWFRVVSAVLIVSSPVTTTPLRADDGINFNRDIRPILSENCFSCHGQDGSKRKADLRLDDRAVAIEAGAIVPKDPAASELVKRIHSSDPDTHMPPAKSNRRGHGGIGGGHRFIHELQQELWERRGQFCPQQRDEQCQD